MNWTLERMRTLEGMKRVERSVRYHQQDGELINRINAALRYLDKRETRNKVEELFRARRVY